MKDPHPRLISSAIALFLVLFFVGQCRASIGDRLQEFAACVQDCKLEECSGPNQIRIPVHRRLLLWDCPAECDYACQHAVTEDRVATQKSIVQFHGKWPFYRLLGMQEPFSVLFSFMNLLVHKDGLTRIRKYVPKSCAFRVYMKTLAWFGISAWMFSIAFHARDLWITEKLDYLAAGAYVMYMCYFAAVRVFKLYECDRRSILVAFSVGMLALFAGHVSFLLLVKWNYMYNMVANVIVGVAGNFLWFTFCIQRFLIFRRWWMLAPLAIGAMITAAMALELFDFPPWGYLIDAHSLWHLGTVIPSKWLYSFLIRDVRFQQHHRMMRARKGR